MRIFAAWLLRHATTPALSPTIASESHRVFMSGRCSLTRILRSLGRGFLARTRSFTSATLDTTAAGRCSETSFGECAETRTELARNPARPGLLSVLGAARLRACQNHVRSRQQNVTRQQRGATGSRPSRPTPGTLGCKALPTSSKPSPWIHVTWSYSWTWQSLTPCFDNSQPR